jgi:hypothetical protein
MAFWLTSFSMAARKRAKHDNMRAPLESVHRESVDAYFDLYSVANLSASSRILRARYSFPASPALWVGQQRCDGADILAGGRATSSGAALLHRVFDWRAPEVRGAAVAIFDAACVSGDTGLVRWYVATFGIAGLYGVTPHSLSNILVDVEHCVTIACEHGHELVADWILELFGVSLESISWYTGFNRAIENRHVSTLKWIQNSLPPPKNDDGSPLRDPGRIFRFNLLLHTVHIAPTNSVHTGIMDWIIYEFATPKEIDGLLTSCRIYSKWLLFGYIAMHLGRDSIGAKNARTLIMANLHEPFFANLAEKL